MATSRAKKPLAVESSPVQVETEDSVATYHGGYKGLMKQPYVLGLACFSSLGGILFGYVTAGLSARLEADCAFYPRQLRIGRYIWSPCHEELRKQIIRMPVSRGATANEPAP